MVFELTNLERNRTTSILSKDKFHFKGKTGRTIVRKMCTVFTFPVLLPEFV